MGLAFERANNLYVVDQQSATIQKFTPGGIGSPFGTGQYSLYIPEGIAIDSAGNLYVSNYGSGLIVKFTPGGAGSMFASTGLNEPSFIAIIPEPCAIAMFATAFCFSIIMPKRREHQASRIAAKDS